jgi:hypothetical protein
MHGERAAASLVSWRSVHREMHRRSLGMIPMARRGVREGAEASSTILVEREIIRRHSLHAATISRNESLLQAGS